MSAIPSRLAQTARASRNAIDARQRVIQLYRDWYRSAPEVIALYTLSVSPAEFRHAIRRRFEYNRHVTDLKTIDVLIHKSRVDWQEAVNAWKLPDHVPLLLQDPVRPKKTFLQQFYEGRDGDAIIPAASGVA